jgi:hypothetical protein
MVRVNIVNEDGSLVVSSLTVAIMIGILVGGGRAVVTSAVVIALSK